MRPSFAHVVSFLSLFLALNVSAVVRYVDLNSLDPRPPYTNWATASTNIQVAIDAAYIGDEVLVTNGVYASGGKVNSGTMTNRVMVTKKIHLRSVNGPEFTTIQGQQVPGTTNGDGAIRCVYLGHLQARLSGFTLTGGATRTNGDYAAECSGGGIWCTTDNPSVSNCVIVGNSATGNGGGAFYGSLTDCVLKDNWTTGNGGGASGGSLKRCRVLFNRATLGGGIHSSTSPSGPYHAQIENCAIFGNVATAEGGGVNASPLNHCTISGNRALKGGGANGAYLTNCIISLNTARNGADHLNCELEYCCATPWSTTGTGNIDVDPKLTDGIHLAANSPCLGAALSSTSNIGVDIDGEGRPTPPSIGCDEYWPGSATGMLAVAVSSSYSTVASGFPVRVTGVVNGHASVSMWDFGNGTMATNSLLATHTWFVPGDYQVVLWAANDSMPSGVSGTGTVHVVEAPVHYVAPDSASPTPPYVSWETAATNIQDAVDACNVPGALVLVTNGIYATGGRAMRMPLTNRVAINKPITVRSVNGPDFTLIRGNQTVFSRVRCVYLSGEACLSGFTLSEGASYYAGDSTFADGGGLWCESEYSVATNCVVTNCVAEGFGGGVCSGSLINCTIRSNTASYGGGAAYSVVNGCVVTQNRARQSGGGVHYGTLNNCTLRGNSAGSGGGAAMSTLINCLLTDNAASYLAGGSGVSGSFLQNCTLVRHPGWGVSGSRLQNCIVYSSRQSNYDSETVLSYCCTIPKPKGIGNITNAPLFVDPDHGDFRLHPASPCINAGDNTYVFSETDLDNNPRTFGDVVDIGAYEAQSPKMTVPQLTGMALENNGSFQLGFTNVTGVSFVVLTTTNLALPESSWSVISNGVVEWPTGSGHYQLIDSSATNRQQSYYRIRSP